MEETKKPPLLLTVALLSCAFAHPAAGAERRWYDVNLNGQKVGYVESSFERIQVDGRPALRTREISRLKIARLQQVIEIESETTATCRTDGQPLSFRHHRSEGGLVRTVTGRRKGERLEVEQTVGRQSTRRTIPLGPNVFLASTFEPLFYDDLKEGFSVKGTAILEDQGDAQPFRLAVTGQERARSGESYWVVEAEVDVIKTRARVAMDGHMVALDLVGMGIGYVETDRESALRLDATMDIFSAALFAASAPIPHREDLAELELLLTDSAGEPIDIVQDDRQRATSSKGGTMLQIRGMSAPKTSASLPVEDERVVAYLAGTPYETLDDPALVKASRKAVAGAKTVWPAVRRLTAFVDAHIADKTLSQSFTSASEAYSSGVGDCTEHAVLFSALAKIAGIPTRLVTGLVYVGGPKNQFGYHEWAEVWTGTAWHPVDPTFGQATADPTHVKFAVAQSDPAGLRKASLVAASRLGNLELRVVSFTPRGQPKVRLP